MKFERYSKVFVIVTCIIGILISITVYATNSNQDTEIKNEALTKTESKKEEILPVKNDEFDQAVAKMQQKKEEVTINSFIEAYGISKEDLLKIKTELKSWEEVSKYLYNNKINDKLSKEQIVELYNNGYDLQDINRAEQIARSSNKNVKEILTVRGIKDDTKNTNVKSWDEVANILNVDTSSHEEKIGLTDEKIEKLTKEGFTKKQIIDSIVLSKKYEKEDDEILKKVKEGKGIEDIEKEYEDSNNTSQKNEDKQLLIKFSGKPEDKEQVIDENTTKYIENGFSLQDVELAKSLGKKYNKNLEDILTVKKAKNGWNNVISILEGDK